jgi:hypothetical protein
VITVVALLLAAAIPAVGLDAQRADACPLGSDCPPGTPWHPKTTDVESKGSPGIQLDWTNTATDERFVAFEIHRRERHGDVFVDISPDVTNIMQMQKQSCVAHCYTPLPAPDAPTTGLGASAKPIGTLSKKPPFVGDLGGGWVYTGIQTTYEVWGLPYGSEQSFRVRAKNLETDMVSEWSEEVFALVGYPSFSTKPSKPNPNPPTGPLGLHTSFKDQGVELTWLYDVEPPTSFKIYRDGKGVGNPYLSPSSVIEDVRPSPWSPASAPTSALTEPVVYQTGFYVYTDVFQYSLSGRYAYKVCPVFGTGIPLEGTCSEIVRTPVGPLLVDQSWGQEGAELTWAYDVNPPTSFRIFRDSKVVGNPALAPDWVKEDLTPNPWSPAPPPSSALTQPTVYQTGMYAYTDVFESKPFSTYSYKVCPVFGVEMPTEGTCSATVEVSNYRLERVEKPQMPPSPDAGLGG